MSELKILHLTLEKKWFDMILSGVKTEEYRKIKPYWDNRLNKSYDVVRFRNGYQKDAPVMVVELRLIEIGLGIFEWGAPVIDKVYILKLGLVLESHNIKEEL